MDAVNFLDQAASTLRSAQTPTAETLSRVAPDKARKAAVEFEGFFLAMALENMFSGIETDGLFGGGHGEKVFRSMMLQEYGKAIAERGGIGLADAVQREIIRLQEVQSHDPK
jgi:Rod binding domain-containing protein